ncbi:MAG: ATP-binding cassette domain-containing protein, partial [Bacteroidota bacterium]
IGYLPEHNPLYLDMYVQEFLHFVGRIYQLDKRRLQSRIDEVIQMTGLGREQHKKIGALSKGYRQRVGLSQALIHDPELLILDEPTTGLDPNQIGDILELIREVGKVKTVIFSSHILSEVETIADRVVIINQGKIVADSPVDRLRNHSEDETVIKVAFDKAGFDFEALSKLAGYRRFEQVSAKEFELRCDPETDLRADLFAACVAQDNIIMSLNKETYTLEDAFKKLTR